MNRKTRVAVLFGGRSAEHEVSLQSAKNIISALNPTKYEPVLIGIDRSGTWFLNGGNPNLGELNDAGPPVSFVAADDSGALVSLSPERETSHVDVIFPVLHGPDGEDGAVQGLARLAGVPCVSADVLGSSIAMDKDVSKRLLRDSGVLVSRYIVVRRGQVPAEIVERIESELGYPVFVKPANLGSSVGVSKASNPEEVVRAVEFARQYDEKVLIEAMVVGRELECGVLGNADPIVSVVGEVVTDDGFYTYEKKYIDEHGATLAIPADIDDATQNIVQQTALSAFRALEGRGMARVDMFLTATGEVVVNEVNTIPGFTQNSMYPKLWEATGMSVSEVIDRLIALAMEDFEHRNGRKLEYRSP